MVSLLQYRCGSTISVVLAVEGRPNLLHDYKGHAAMVTTLSFSFDNGMVAPDDIVRIWSVVDERQLLNYYRDLAA